MLVRNIGLVVAAVAATSFPVHASEVEAAGQAEAQLIVARDAIPVVANLVVASFKWRADPQAGCASAQAAAAAATVLEDNIETLRTKLEAETGHSDVVTTTFGDMPDVKSMAADATERFCRTAPAEALMTEDKAAFDKAGSMAQLFFSQFANAAKAHVEGDTDAACANFKIASATAMELNAFMRNEGQHRETMAKAVRSDEMISLLAGSESMLEEALSACDI